jgi:tetratricopeptide (TPR) repeat protein
MRQAFANLYKGLDTPSRQVLHALAAARRSLGVDEVSHVLATSSEATGLAVWELLSRRILRLDRGVLSFQNELQRAFAYYAMGQELRKFLHGQLARALLNRGDATDLPTIIEAAHHFARAGEHEQGATALLRAEPDAVHSGAPHELEAALRAVLAGSHPPDLRSRLVVFLGRSLSAQGKYLEAVALLTPLTEGASQESEQAVAATVLVAQARQRARLGEDHSIAAVTKEAVRSARLSGSEPLLAVACQTAIEVASESGDALMLSETLSTTDRLVARSASPEVRARALLTRSYSLMVSGEFETAAMGFAESAKLFEELSFEAELAQSLNGRGICLLSVGRHPEALPLFAVSLRLAQKRHDVVHEATVLSNLGVAYEDVAMFSDATHCYDNGRRTPTGRHAPRHLALASANAANLSIVTGNLDVASEYLDTARGFAEQCALWRVTALLDLTEADLMMARGETELAWPLVASATRTTSGRQRALDTNGKAIRLALHYALASKGKEGLRASLADFRRSPRSLRLADRLEIEAFVTWAERRAGLEVSTPDIVSRIVGSGMLGVLATLAALYVYPSDELSRAITESGADMVERIYPASCRSMTLARFEDL